MLNAVTQPPSPAADEPALIARSRQGDRSAYGQIVVRYQSLICAVAFSACRDAARSEDVAQDTFITAWRNLLHLRDPAGLKPWLCGIARNLARDAQRKHRRHSRRLEPDSIAAHDVPSPRPAPDQAASAREDAVILSRALESLPDRYREPLVLFYRQDESVRNVAAALGLSEDTVKQRLSRGRNMLRAQLTRTVENSLRQTKPAPAFALAVVAALPAIGTPAKAATLAGATAKTLPAAKSFFGASFIGVIAGPLLSFIAAPLATRWHERNTKSPRERRFMIRYTWAVCALVFSFGILTNLFAFNPDLLLSHPILFSLVLVAQVASIVALSLYARVRQKRIRQEELP